MLDIAHSAFARSRFIGRLEVLELSTMKKRVTDEGSLTDCSLRVDVLRAYLERLMYNYLLNLVGVRPILPDLGMP
jgi:hypothetical protein